MNQTAGSGMSFSTLRRQRKENLDDAVARLNGSKGVFGVMVTANDWSVISSTFDHNLTFYWKHQMEFVEALGLASIRDADPENDLQFLRVQSTNYEILLSIAKDHRVLVVFSSTNPDPLKGCVLKLKQAKREKKAQKKAGKSMRPGVDPCRPHTKIIGGKEKVIITEKISGTLIDQNDDINNI